MSQYCLLPVSHIRLERPVNWHVGQTQRHRTERFNGLASPLVGTPALQVSISVTAHCSLENWELETNTTAARSSWRDKCSYAKSAEEVTETWSHLTTRWWICMSPWENFTSLCYGFEFVIPTACLSFLLSVPHVHFTFTLLYLDWSHLPFPLYKTQCFPFPNHFIVSACSALLSFSLSSL